MSALPPDDHLHPISRGRTQFTHGAFGELAVALWREKDGMVQVVVVKTVRDPNADPNDGEKNSNKNSELAILRHHILPHPNIVPLLTSYSKRRGELSFVFPYCPTDLQIVLDYRRQQALPLLSTSTILCIVSDLAVALDHLHNKCQVVHRDLKPGNLLLSSQGTMQLCDFGLATSTATTATTPTTIGLCTLHYRPPEILLGHDTAINATTTSYAVDLYSSACIIAALLTGFTLFPGRTALDQLSRITAVLGSPASESTTATPSVPIATILPRGLECPPIIHQLLRQWLVFDPTQRSWDPTTVIPALLQLTGDRARLQCELLPNAAVEEPFLIPFTMSEEDLQDDPHWEWNEERTLELAAQRRALNTMSPDWRGRLDRQSLAD